MFRGSFRAVSSGGGGGGGSADLVWASASGSSFTFTGSQNAVKADVSSNPVEIQLPSAAASTGKIYTIKHVGGDLATNALTITSPTSGQIDGLSSIQLFQEKLAVRASSDGSDWSII